MTHDWITLHRLEFDAPVGNDVVLGPGLPGADVTRSCIGFQLNDAGDLETESPSWAIMGIFAGEKDARAVFDDPEAAIPALSRTREAWHGLAIPLSHRGTVTWRGIEQTDSALRCGTAEGPLVVVTSAGYHTPPDTARLRRFFKGVADVLEYYGGLPGNAGRGAFNGSSVDGRGGFTLSLWNDTSSMLAAAYKSGVHKSQLDRHTADPVFDFSSFSRLALQDSKGLWDGAEFAA